MIKKRVLGIDYGKVRIGLALADARLTIASPIGCILNKGEKKNKVAFAELINKHDVGTVVLGLPALANGTLTPIALDVNKFGVWIENEFGLPVIYQDERLSSWAAEEEIREKMRIRDPKKIKELVDSMAASMVLSDWLKRCSK